MPRLSLESWIDALQARGRYTFLREEAVRDSGLSATAVRKALQRAVKSGRLVRPKEYFFVIVPLEYRSAGGPPPSWFVADLMAAMKLPYYVALLSAAAAEELFGLSLAAGRFPAHSTIARSPAAVDRMQPGRGQSVGRTLQPSAVTWAGGALRRLHGESTDAWRE
jgi:hypothetical protein